MLRVKKSEVVEALEFLYGEGYIEQLRRDERYYVEILMKFAAQRCDIELV